MSVYRRSTIPVPLRTAANAGDLAQLHVVQRVLTLLNEPSASAAELSKLIDAMPVLAARLGERFTARFGHRESTSLSELSFLGNRELEAILLQLLEDLTDFSAEQRGIPAHGSVFPRSTSVLPPSFPPSPSSRDVKS
jgi:hypothetical protein